MNKELRQYLITTIAWTKKSQIESWWVIYGGKWCVYTKIIFCQNFIFKKKKLAKGSTYLVYNGILRRRKKYIQNLHKHNIFISGTKIYYYELICAQTKAVCLMKKKSVWSWKIVYLEI